MPGHDFPTLNAFGSTTSPVALSPSAPSALRTGWNRPRFEEERHAATAGNLLEVAGEVLSELGDGREAAKVDSASLHELDEAAKDLRGRHRFVMPQTNE